MATARPVDRRAAAEQTSARRPWWLVAVGLLAVLAIAVATLPASLLERRLAAAGVSAGSMSGTIWNGAASGLAWRTAPIGDLRWTVSPLGLLGGRVAGDLDLVGAVGTLRGRYAVSFSGALSLEGATLDVPVESLSALPLGMPRGWRGRVSGRLDELVVANGWPTSLRGELDMDGLVAPPPRSASIGSYHVVIPDPQATGGIGDGGLSARVVDKEGPFSFDGRFTLERDRSFLLDGTLAPRGSTPPELARSLEFLGPADANGRRPVSVSGTL
jgi:general secretion pathway protein N